MTEPDPSTQTPDIAGTSARREYERRVARREQRIRAAHPRLGGLILGLTEEPQSTRAWARGAGGEELVGRALDRLTEHGVRVLHDRRIPGTRANIDHIAISARGVFVIDSKRYHGRPRRRVTGGLLRPRTETLLVGSRDCTKLVDGVAWQVDVVRAAVAAIDAVTGIHGMLCFVDADWPLFGGAFAVAGVDVLWPKKACRRIGSGAGVEGAFLDQIHRALAVALPRA